MNDRDGARRAAELSRDTKLFKLDIADDGAASAVEFDLVHPEVSDDLLRARIRSGIEEIDSRLLDVDEQLEKLNAEIDRLTNHADGLDNMIAVGSGILAGVIDIIFVGEFSLQKAHEIGEEKLNDFVIRIAKTQDDKVTDLESAVRSLEERFPIAADKATNDFGGGKQHHLRDFSHHPTPVGLLFSLATQFTKKVYGTDTAGRFRVVALNEKGLSLVGKNIPEKITFGVINWFFHMVSDMAGSSSSIGKNSSGTGLPGPIVSLLKEISALPIFRKMDENGNKEFSVWISKLFNGTLLGERDENGRLTDKLQFDLRTEIGVAAQLGKQAIPVIINECVVRGFYFIRRLAAELKKTQIERVGDLGRIDWRKTLPFKNRTITRMLTISTGTMAAIDIAAAAIRSAAKSGGFPPAFFANMIVRVNFVGIGRFAVAAATDIKMGIEKRKAENERMSVMFKELYLMNAKVSYMLADTWTSARDAGECIRLTMTAACESYEQFIIDLAAIGEDMKKISQYIPAVEEKNPGLIAELEDIFDDF